MDPKVIVSLTTHDLRLTNGTVERVIKNILDGTFKELRLVLTLYKDDESLIPASLRKMIDDGSIELIVSDINLRPHLKYFYAMQKYRNLPVITIDDDYVYQEKYIETMLKKLGNYDEFSPRAAGVQGHQHIMRGEILLPCFWLNLTKEIVDTRINDTWITAYLVRIKANMRWEECPEIFNDLATEMEEGKKTVTNCEMTGGYPIELQRKAMELSFEALRN